MRMADFTLQVPDSIDIRFDSNQITSLPYVNLQLQSESESGIVSALFHILSVWGLNG